MNKRHHDTGKETEEALQAALKNLLYKDGKVFRHKNGASIKRAGSQRTDGYRSVGVGGSKYLEHRVIWAIVYGAWPESEIDHIDGDKANNVISNLRLATRRINVLNTPIRSVNKSGERNIYWSKPHKAWRVSFLIDKNKHDLGCYKNFDDAVSARNKFMQESVHAF